MANNNLLDDNTIQSEHKSSCFVEIKRVEVWLSILSALGFVIGTLLCLIGLSIFIDDDWSTIIIVLEIMAFVQGGLFIYWSYVTFQYTRQVKWYQPESLSNRMEHLLEQNSHLWRATALLFLGLFAMLIVAGIGGLWG